MPTLGTGSAWLANTQTRRKSAHGEKKMPGWKAIAVGVGSALLAVYIYNAFIARDGETIADLGKPKKK